MEIKIDFKKLQSKLSNNMPLREHEDGYVSLASCDKDWAPRIPFCSKEAFIGEIEDYIKDNGIEEFIASHLMNTHFLKYKG